MTVDKNDWEHLSYEDKNHELFVKQTVLLKQFLERGAISQAQYDKSLHGNYQRTLPLRFDKCTEVFLFDLPVEQCLEGAASRVGTQREDLPWVENEFDPEFKQYILDFQKDQMPAIRNLLEKYSSSRMITVFHSRKEADNWIDGNVSGGITHGK